MNEHDLESLARKIGAARAERVDVERIARGVVAGLKEAPTKPRVWWIRPGVLRVAAAIVLLLGGGLVARRWTGSQPTAAAHPDHYIFEDLNGLSSDQLQDVLTTLDQTLQEGDLPVDADLNDLSPAQLRAVLQAIEG